MLTDARIAELLALCEKREDGPWSMEWLRTVLRFVNRNEGGWDDVSREEENEAEEYGRRLPNYPYKPEDAAFISAASDPVTGYEAVLRELQEARRLLAHVADSLNHDEECGVHYLVPCDDEDCGADKTRGEIRAFLGNGETETKP